MKKIKTTKLLNAARAMERKARALNMAAYQLRKRVIVSGHQGA